MKIHTYDNISKFVSYMHWIGSKESQRYFPVNGNNLKWQISMHKHHNCLHIFEPMCMCAWKKQICTQAHSRNAEKCLNHAGILHDDYQILVKTKCTMFLAISKKSDGTVSQMSHWDMIMEVNCD